MKPWEAKIPCKAKNRHVKRCYIYWRYLTATTVAGGKVVWLTDREKTLAYLKYSRLKLEEVLERDRLEEYKKYMHQTVD
jgi:hypothetical protein